MPEVSVRPLVSIVVPCRNDADALGRTLAHLETVQRRGDIEVIVAACGARDATTAAAGARARVIWPGGSTRADLMNAGAGEAAAPVLLFLHADSLLPDAAVDLVQAALSDPRVVGGAFAHRFAEPDWRLGIVSLINRVRYRITGNYYGDQAMFIRLTAFHRLGGFRPLSLLEDLDLSQRLRRVGRTRLVPAPVATSGRRFLQRGPWRTLAWCGWLLLLWTLSLDTERHATAWRGPEERAPGARGRAAGR